MILLDTHVLIWAANEPAKLSSRAKEVVRAAGQSGGLAISAITLWELAWLATHGRMEIIGTVDAFVEEISARTSIRPITTQIAILASQLPKSYTSDPCDRLIGATAMIEGFALVTRDRNIRECKQISTIW
jgi:PIN domain nuclease of toxin-antitoxin system